MRHKILALLFLILLTAGCGRVIEVVTPPPPGWITPTPQIIVLTPTPKPTSPPQTPTPVSGGAVQATASIGTSAPTQSRTPHGLIYALILPLLLVGIPWAILEIFVSRYVRPVGIDITKIQIKAQDGLFIETPVSITARKTLSLAATTASWPQVQKFAEKAIEQEILDEAIKRPSLDELEGDLKQISEALMQSSVTKELQSDFGIKILRFNIEVRYPQETKDALNRKAEASAGGHAYIAYAAAAGLNPNTEECRQLYKIYQETSGRVDAARNLGGGISNLANVLGPKGQGQAQGEENVSS